MIHLLDTNICIELIRHRPDALVRRLSQCVPGDVGVSAVTVAELYHGAARSARPEQNRLAADQFLLPLEIAVFDQEAARSYGEIRAHLEREGTPIGAMDLLIAATALALQATVVTNNTREFRRVPLLVVEDWTAAT